MTELTPLNAPRIPLRDILTYVASGDVFGFALLGPEETVGWTNNTPPGTRVGEVVLKCYQEDNVGIELENHELGTDLFFETDDTNELLRQIGQPLTAADANFLISNLPPKFLDHQLELIDD